MRVTFLSSFITLARSFFLSCFSFFARDIAKHPASGLRSQSGAKIPPQIRAAAVPTRERLRNKKQRPKREKERERESRARSSFTLFPSTSFVLFANFPGDEWFATPLKRLPPTMRPPKQKNIFARRVTQSFFGPREKKKKKRTLSTRVKCLPFEDRKTRQICFLSHSIYSSATSPTTKETKGRKKRKTRNRKASSPPGTHEKRKPNSAGNR